MPGADPPAGRASAPKIRVLVVDDSVVVRKILTDVIKADPALEVIGTAANGRVALQKVASTPPDVVTLDIEMPELDGLATLTEMRKLHPRLPVLMCSSLTERGALTTLDALARGATDYVTKPSSSLRGADDLTAFAADLVARIKAIAPRPASLPRPAAPPLPRVLPAPPGRPGAVDVVAIGISTGGPNALARMIPMLPAQLPVPVLVVQHMPPIFTRMLAERLAGASHVAVKEAQQGERVLPGTVYVAPGDFHMALKVRATGAVIDLSRGPQENSCRPAVDVLFRSVAEAYGAGVLAVVMTGMGRDGLHGATQIRARGGRVLAQDAATSVVWGMPGFVAEAGLADEILPLDELAGAILRRLPAKPRPMVASR